jgi:hypothetical protein
MTRQSLFMMMALFLVVGLVLSVDMAAAGQQ